MVLNPMVQKLRHTIIALLTSVFKSLRVPFKSVRNVFPFEC